MHNKITVFVSGHFNVIHPGHLRLLRFANESGDHLIVAVESDRIAGSTAIVPEELRLEGVSSNSWVDQSFIIDEPVSKLIRKLKPDIVVKGKEHQSKVNPEQEVVDSYGGKLLFSSGEATFSSLDLLRKEFYQSTMDQTIIPLEYMARHNIKNERLRGLINKFSSIKVCVVGDLIVDEYITCEPLGMSQEDPTIVVTPVDTTRFIGGSGIVAAHASGLGAQVDFVTITGSDESCNFVKKKLEEADVKTHLVEDSSRPTTVKQRFRSKGKCLLRVSHLHQTAITPTLQKRILDIIESIVHKVDLLVFSDFNYGCLPQSLVDKISRLAKLHDVMLVADSQSSSQIGNIARFKGMDMITPTEHEARISTRNYEDGLVVLAEQLKKQSLAQNILLKIGAEGLLIHAGNGSKKNAEWQTDRICALNSAPRDVAGAGDSLLITAALALACGADIWEASCLGSLAAAIQVGRVGNIPLTAKGLNMEFKE